MSSLARQRLEEDSEFNDAVDELYRYAMGGNDPSNPRTGLDVDDFMTALRETRVLVARYETSHGVEWVFPARTRAATDHHFPEESVASWIIVSASEDAYWPHQQPVLDTTVAARGIPGRGDIVHAHEADVEIPNTSMAHVDLVTGRDKWGGA